jgi:signal transduction histidine kinase
LVDAAAESRESDVARLVLEAADADRRRFAQDLHDGAQQKFVAAMNSLQLARSKLSGEPDRARQYLDAALAQTDSGLRTLRELVAGIHPAVLTQLGLRAGMESLVSGSPIPVDLDVTARRFPQVLEEAVYFFASEALTNVIKHARAGAAGIVVANGADRLTVEVSDDGIGGATVLSHRHGLTGLSARMRALGGELTLASPRMGGTVARGVIPLAAAAR